jgi:hypothetical protein
LPAAHHPEGAGLADALDDELDDELNDELDTELDGTGPCATVSEEELEDELDDGCTFVAAPMIAPLVCDGVNDSASPRNVEHGGL